MMGDLRIYPKSRKKQWGGEESGALLLCQLPASEAVCEVVILLVIIDDKEDFRRENGELIFCKHHDMSFSIIFTFLIRWIDTFIPSRNFFTAWILYKIFNYSFRL